MNEISSLGYNDNLYEQLFLMYKKLSATHKLVYFTTIERIIKVLLPNSSMLLLMETQSNCIMINAN